MRVLELGRAAIVAAACAAITFPIAAAAEQPVPVSFRNDVMAALSKAGCNMGVCHGNANGKGGFKLSLRGEDPDADYLALSRDQSGRRLNRLEAEKSLCLLKPTLQVAHEGGRRFDADSLEYRILRDWIAAGAQPDPAGLPQLERLEVEPREAILYEPADSLALHVTAQFSDGTQRDVTRLAVYEPAEPIVETTVDGVLRRSDFGETTVSVRYLHLQIPVRIAFVPDRPDFVASDVQGANVVDGHVFERLKELRINPSELADDTVFLRRASLDLLGVPPTAEEAKAFAADTDSQKRSRLIDALLERPEFADFWAAKWADLLRVEEKTLDRKGVQNFHAWIREGIASEKPIDQMARELIAARGSTYTNPEANYYRAMRDPLMRAESAAQVFLGVRLQCAKCHNHPFDRWTQDDYYGWAALFARVQYKVIENRRKDKNDGHEFDGEQLVYMDSQGEIKNPRTGRNQPPRFLGADRAGLDTQSDRLKQLAEWLGSTGNERFLCVQVNRIWFHLLGRGIVEPVDDFRATNPPSHPELLDALAEEFAQSGCNLKHLIRLIMNSRTYQLSAEPNATNADDESHFSHALVRRLSAEQLLDSLSQVLGAPAEFAGYPAGTRASQLPGVPVARPRNGEPASGDRFLIAFGKPQRLQSCECERSDEPTLDQSFQLVGGPLINALLTRPDNRLGHWLDAGLAPSELVTELYWTALSRPPSDEELATAVVHIEGAADRRSALEDVAWAVVNSSEFLLRR